MPSHLWCTAIPYTVVQCTAVDLSLFLNQAVVPFYLLLLSPH